jgi:hypothetical protein
MSWAAAHYLPVSVDVNDPRKGPALAAGTSGLSAAIVPPRIRGGIFPGLFMQR